MEARKKRIHIETEVAVNGRKSAEGLDLSPDGMYIFTTHTFLEGLTVNLEFELEGERFDIRANIKHTEHAVGFGVHFVDMDESVAQKLRTYVASH